VQRALDCIGAAVGLLVLAPLMVAIGCAVTLNDGGPVFYRARRVGKGGRLFRLYKFRSMVVDADKTGCSITVAEDNRITPIGRFLRRHKLDELPQLINVLLGDMSLVGPRPEDPRYVASYSAKDREVLDVRPGITSPASLQFRNEETLLTGEDWELLYTQRILPRKLAMELDYLPRRSTWEDIKVIVNTIRGILS
jgi:lipopolysaccharide/colanic/teichoic acid biosynthesis glycosyltransferase